MGKGQNHSETAQKAVGETPGILDISDKPIPTVWYCLFLRSITEFNLAYRELGEPIDPIEQAELQEAGVHPH